MLRTTALVEGYAAERLLGALHGTMLQGKCRFQDQATAVNCLGKMTNNSNNQSISDENQRLGYIELCATYHRLKNFRASLLGLLPLATGAGFFATLKDAPNQARFIGVFGLLFTLGSFIYEIHGTLLVERLIRIGAEAEAGLGIKWGQFTNRPIAKDSPRGWIGGNTGALVAAIAIYGATLALWGYLAFFYKVCLA